MTGRDFDRGEQSGQRRAEPHTFPVGVPYGPDHRRHPRQGHHLGNVPRADNDDEIGRKPVAQPPDHGEPRIDAEHQEHQVEAGHGDEDPRSRLAEDIEMVGRVLDPAPVVIHVDQVGRHPAEIAPGPLGVFAVAVDMLLDVARNAAQHHHIGLPQGFPFVLGCEKDSRNDREKGQGYDMRQRFPKKAGEAVLHDKSEFGVKSTFFRAISQPAALRGRQTPPDTPIGSSLGRQGGGGERRKKPQRKRLIYRNI